MMRNLVFVILMTPCIAHAEDDITRKIAALPYLAEQRNVAQDGLAVCAGDRSALQKQLTEVSAELEKLKAAALSEKHE